MPASSLPPGTSKALAAYQAEVPSTSGWSCARRFLLMSFVMGALSSTGISVHSNRSDLRSRSHFPESFLKPTCRILSLLSLKHLCSSDHPDPDIVLTSHTDVCMPPPQRINLNAVCMARLSSLVRHTRVGARSCEELPLTPSLLPHSSMCRLLRFVHDSPT